MEWFHDWADWKQGFDYISLLAVTSFNQHETRGSGCHRDLLEAHCNGVRCVEYGGQA